MIGTGVSVPAKKPHGVHVPQYKPHMVYLRKRLSSFIRTRRGSMTQREFARRVGVAQSTVMRIENEDQNVTLETLETLCDAFQVEIGELFPPLPAANRVSHYAAGRHSQLPERAAAIHEERKAPVNAPRRRRAPADDA